MDREGEEPKRSSISCQIPASACSSRGALEGELYLRVCPHSRARLLGFQTPSPAVDTPSYGPPWRKGELPGLSGCLSRKITKCRLSGLTPLGRINQPVKTPFFSLRTTMAPSTPISPPLCPHTHAMPPSTAEFLCLHDHSPAKEILSPEILVWGLRESRAVWLLAWMGVVWT